MLAGSDCNPLPSRIGEAISFVTLEPNCPMRLSPSIDDAFATRDKGTMLEASLWPPYGVDRGSAASKAG